MLRTHFLDNRFKYSVMRRWKGGALLLFTTLQVQAFSLDDVATRARSLASESFKSPTSHLPETFRKMTFAEYQQIQFNRSKRYWNNIKIPFKLEFYHLGMYFDIPVKINEVTATSVHQINYDPDYFNFGTIKYNKKALKNLGFAGFKILYPINQPHKEDEMMSILGASYFRVIGKGQVYGLSARGLAIDTGLPSGEEFPRFREFWIERPKVKDKHLVIYALLDSPRATGAYRMVVIPGHDTLVNIQSRIYLRDKVGVLGIAPLSSMYLFGANQPSPQINYRPQLHDSEGLAIHGGNGEWIWHPLNNPKRLAVNTFSVEDPQGFGLLQRTRHFSDYQDLDDRYDLRPSAWIEPRGLWGKGRIELIELPTEDETNDNIAAFWVPANLPAVGKPIDLAYRIHFTRNENKLHSPEIAWVKETLISTGDVKSSNLIREPDGTIALLVDFVGPVLAALDEQAPVTTQVTTDANTTLVENSLRYNQVTRGWRLTLRFKVINNKKPVEMWAMLVKAGKPLSETWHYRLPADE